jgi:integrase
MANKKGHRRFGSIRKLPSGRLQARYLGPDGILRSAPATFATSTLAQKWLTLIEAEIVRGEWIAPEAGEVLLGNYAERWLQERKLSPRTHEIYESIYRLNIKPHLGGMSLDSIKSATVRAWRKHLLDEGRPEPQAVKAYRLLRSIFNTAVREDEILKVNPCRIKGFDTYHTPERPSATLRQLEALAELMPARFHALILLAGFSGLRWGELAALRRTDIDMSAGTVRVHRKLIAVRGKLIFGPPKSEAGIRTVALPEAALRSMRVHLDLNVDPDAEALVFTGDKGSPLRAPSFRRTVQWDQACREAGLPEDFHFHDLRHLGNMLAAEAGASTRELMRRLGQSTMRAALIYQHATPKRDREIARAIDLRISQIKSEDDDDSAQHSDDDGSSDGDVRLR